MIMVLVLALRPSFNEAFVPTSIARTKATTSSIAFIEPAAVITSSTTSWSTSSSLHMGIVEEFITSTDSKTRKSKNEAYLKELQKRVDTINALESEIEELSDEQLQAKTQEFKARLASGKEDINGPILEEMFAVVREAAWYVVLIQRSSLSPIRL